MRCILIASFAFTSSAVFAQAGSQDAMVQLALREYAAVATGVRLERRCDFLAPDKAKAFEADVAEIRSGLAAQLNEPESLDWIDRQIDAFLGSGQNSACDAAARETVEETNANAGEWAGP